MITVLRNYFKKSSQVVLWVIIAAFVIGMLPMAFRQITSTNIWAMRINGEEIGEQEYKLERERMNEQIMALRSQYGEYADLIMMMQMGTADPQVWAIRSLAKQELLNQFADTIGVHVSQDFVIRKMSDPAYVIQQLGGIIPPQLVDPVTGIDQGMLKKYLKHFDLSVEMFERIIERTLADRFVTDVVMSSFYLPQFDVKQKYISEHAKKNFSILVLPITKLLELEKKNEITNEALKGFYDAESQRHWVHEKRTGVMWEFDQKSYDISVADKQIEEYYENNKVKSFIDTPAKIQVRRILLTVSDDLQAPAVQEKASRIKEEIAKDPTQFAEIAKRVSEDKDTASNGGLMESFVRGTYDISFDRTAFLLRGDGDVSDVIQTKQGYEILQRVNKEPQTFKTLSSVKNEIKNTLMQQAFRKQFTGDMKKVIDQEETLADFIRKKGGIPKELVGIALDDTQVAQHLFKLPVGKRTFFVDGQKGIALRLDKMNERYLPGLDSIKNTVTSDLQEQRARKKLQENAQEAKKLLGTTPFKQVREKFDAGAIQVGWMDLEKGSSESLKKQGIPVAQMLQMEKSGTIMTSMGDESGFVIRLDKIEPWNEQEFQAKQGDVARSLENERTQQYMEGFVASLYRNAKIETNESVITLES